MERTIIKGKFLIQLSLFDWKRFGLSIGIDYREWTTSKVYYLDIKFIVGLITIRYKDKTNQTDEIFYE